VNTKDIRKKIREYFEVCAAGMNTKDIRKKIREYFEVCPARIFGSHDDGMHVKAGQQVWHSLLTILFYRLFL
jgi:hypothetical protein